MSDTSRNQIAAIAETAQDLDAALNRQNVSLLDYHTVIRNAKDQDISLEEASTELGRIFKNLDSDFSEIEKKAADAPATISSLGLASFLCNVPPIQTDPVGGPGESKSLYEELIGTYSATERSKEYCNAALNILNMYNLRRTAKPNLKSRRLELSSESHLMIHKHLQQSAAQTMALSFFTHDRLAMGNVVEVVVDRIFRIALVMRGWVVEGVNVRGSEEHFELEDKNKTLRPTDLWTPSAFEVFRVITRNAQAALLHYYTPQQPDHSLRNYLQWLNSLATLFTQPCKRCGKYVENGLPPTFRDYKSLFAYHESCRLLSFTPI